MISLGEYFGKWLNQAGDASIERAGRLCEAVNRLIEMAEADGVAFPINPATGSQVSGKEFGGFRPQSCTIGAPNSKHKLGAAVDLFDPLNAIDAWCMANLDKLAECGIYLEHPDATPHWSHWAIMPPVSGNRVFRP